MPQKNIKILIGVVLIIAAACVAYFLDLSEGNKIKAAEAEIAQTKASIASKQSYYAVIDSKIAALNDAGWSTKQKSIEINFTQSPFFVPKINTFFQTMVSSAGMTMGGITSSTPTSVGAVPQAATESTTKSSKASENITTTTSQAGYFGQLKGPVKKTTVNLSISGSYRNFTNLLTKFENQTRIITIKSVAVSPNGVQETTKSGSTNNLSFSVVLDIYSY